MITNDTRNCLHCNRSLHGRTDKKFCNDYCRNAHHNRLNSRESNHMRNVDNWLRRNRRIIQELLGSRQAAVFSHATLSSRGFLFNYCTSTHTGRNGAIRYCCYDYSYRVLDARRVQLTRTDDG